MTIETNGNHYFCYDINDQDYFGARSLIEAERQLLQARRGKEAPTAGLALSGGGIRSASFSLGVLQALSYKHWLQKIDYLSTVSGGGYIGSCMSYLLHRDWGKPGEPVCYGVERENFPLGSYPMTGQDPADREAVGASTMNNEEIKQQKQRGSLLRFLRQHAKYLTPGNGHTILTLIAVLMRNSLLSFVFYLFLLAVVFATVGKWVLFPAASEFIDRLAPQSGIAYGMPDWLNVSLAFALLLAGIFVVLIPVYAFITYLFGRAYKKNEPHKFRYRNEKRVTYLLMAAIFFGVIGSVPIIYNALQGLDLNALLSTSVDSGKPANNTGDNSMAVFSAIVSAITGIVSALGAFAQTTKLRKRLWLQNILISVAVLTLLYAMAMLALWLTGQWYAHWSWWWLGTLAILFVGWFQNLNYVSMHRYYRDRLAETFMPDVSKVLAGKDDPGLSAVGNETSLTQLWGGNDPRRHDTYLAPYHIINTNVILASSRINKFRGRGGDNFILSPLFCGSNATGWAATSSVIYKGLSVASAMAISGAALNTNAGCGGEGLTRQPLLSLLLGILNVRLGYWLPNPKWLTRRSEFGSAEQQQYATLCQGKPSDIRIGKWLSPLLMHLSRLTVNGDETPNMFYPGAGELLLRKNLNEDSALVQLSDGGHFENLGMYELIRRRLKLIMVIDGGADPGYQFDDLRNAIEKVRADFGALISFEHSIEELVPKYEPSAARPEDGRPPMCYAKRGYLIGRIDYANNTTGVLLYMTTTFVAGLTADLYGYRNSHPEFPDEPTSDQFFDEKQFEAYRELGYQLAYKMLNDTAVTDNPVVKAAFGL